MMESREYLEMLLKEKEFEIKSLKDKIKDMMSSLDISKGEIKSLKFVIECFNINQTLQQEESIEQPIEESIEQPIEESIESIEQPIEESIEPIEEPIEVINHNNQNFNNDMGKYLSTGNDTLLKNIFHTYKTKHYEILYKISKDLPKNIEYFINLYKLEKEYDIIKKSSILKNNIDGLTIQELTDKFQNLNSPITYEKYLKIALICHPLIFNDIFYTIKKIKQYKNKILDIKIELYGDNNPLITEDEIKNKYNKSRKIKHDYSIVDIDELYKFTIGKSKQQCYNVIENLIKSNRDDIDIIKFKYLINKHFKNPIL